MKNTKYFEFLKSLSEKKFEFDAFDNDIKSDPYIMSQIISEKNFNKDLISIELLNNELFLILALENKPQNIFNLDLNKIEDTILLNLLTWFSSLYQDINLFKLISDEKINEQLIINILKNNPDLYKNIPEIFKNNKKIYQIVKFNNEFKNAGNEIKNDYLLSLEAININKSNFEYVSESLKSNILFLDKCIHIVPNILKYIPVEVQENTEIVFKCLEADFENIIYINKNILSKKSISNKIKEIAINNKEHFVKFFQVWDDDMLNDEELINIFKEEISNSFVVNVLGKNIKKNKDLMSFFIEKNCLNYEYIDESLYFDIFYLKECFNLIKNSKNLENACYIFKYLPKKLDHNMYYFEEIYKKFRNIFSSHIYSILLNKNTIFSEKKYPASYWINKFENKNKIEKSIIINEHVNKI